MESLHREFWLQNFKTSLTKNAQFYRNLETKVTKYEEIALVLTIKHEINVPLLNVSKPID